MSEKSVGASFSGPKNVGDSADEVVSDLKNVARVCAKAAEQTDDPTMQQLAKSVMEASQKAQAVILQTTAQLESAPGLALGGGGATEEDESEVEA